MYALRWKADTVAGGLEGHSPPDADDTFRIPWLKNCWKLDITFCMVT